jgi:Concanavalin A-like lectin/glucanases superfamily
VYIAEIPQKNSVNPPYSGYYVAIGDGGDVYLTTSLPTPEPRRAYAFDGVNDSIPIATLSDTSPMTIAFWAKNSVGSSRAFVSNRLAGGRYFFGLSGTTQMFFYNNSGTPPSHLSTTITPNNGAWHHYAYVLGPNYVRMYFDNTQVYSGSTVLSKIGSRQFVLANDSNGYMATHMFDIRLYTGALLPTNIQHIYSFGASGTNPQVSNALAWYKADDTNATVAYDSSGLGRHGTKTNITPATFHYQGSDVPYSFQNTVGFNVSDTLGYIPRNESNILYDVLGTLLQFSGF